MMFTDNCPYRYKYKYKYLEKQEQLRIEQEKLLKKEITQEEYENSLILSGIKYIDGG